MRKTLNFVALLFWVVTAQAATTRIIHTLEQEEGMVPGGPPILYKGNLYGTTVYGKLGFGSVYRLYPQKAGGYAFVCLHEFNGTTDGSFPMGQLATDASGNLFGVTTSGGGSGEGTVWELVRPANLADSWTFQLLWNFTGLQEGGYAAGGLVFNSGALYGINPCQEYRLVPDQNGVYQFQLINSLISTANALPSFDAAGNMYAVVSFGGTNIYQFSLDSQGNWVSTSIAPISGELGNPISPAGDILRDPTGAFYGVSAAGGAFGGFQSGGTLYKVYQDSTGAWVTKVLRSFNPATENATPMFSLIHVKKAYYGVLYSNGGEVFQAYPSATTKQWTVNDLLDDTQDRSLGTGYSALTSDAAGNLYGASNDGGDLTQCNGTGCGVIWEVTP